MNNSKYTFLKGSLAILFVIFVCVAITTGGFYKSFNIDWLDDLSGLAIGLGSIVGAFLVFLRVPEALRREQRIFTSLEVVSIVILGLILLVIGLTATYLGASRIVMFLI